MSELNRRHEGTRVDDSELCSRSTAGHRETLRELFEQTSTRIYRMLLRMTGDPEVASDLTQETYVKGFERLNQFDGRSQIETWLYRIAVNEALQHRRRGATASLKIQEWAAERRVEAPSRSTDLQLDVEMGLAALSYEDRALLLLRYQEGLNYRSISEVLRCPEGTVASRLNRARDRLREVLRKSYE